MRPVGAAIRAFFRTDDRFFFLFARSIFDESSPKFETHGRKSVIN